MKYLRVLKSGISGDQNSPTFLYHPDHTKKSLLDGILICNKSANDLTISIAIRDKHKHNQGTDGQDVFIAKDVEVPANTTIEMIEGTYPLQHPGPGINFYDELIAYASASDSIDIILAIMSDVN